MLKAGAEEAKEGSLVPDAQFPAPRRNHHSNQRRFDLGRRPEGAGRDAEQQLGTGVILRGHRQQAVVAALGRRRKPLGNLPLHQHGQIFEQAGILEEPEKDRRSNVIGQIAGRLGAPEARLSHQPAQIERENIPFDDLDARAAAEFLAQQRDQRRVHLHGNDQAGTGGKQFSQRTAARADLDYQASGVQPQTVGDARQHAPVGQEMLPQAPRHGSSFARRRRKM